MREILFRGKTASHPSKWIYGYYSQEITIDNEKATPLHFIGTDMVWGDSVGQYTGINDKDGNKIFEGDVIRGKDYGFREYHTELVKFEDGMFGISNEVLADFSEIEIIGNIHDNPELIK